MVDAPDVAAFRRVRLTDRDRFADLRLGDFSPHVLNFSNLVCWQDKYRHRWGVIDNRIAVHNQTLGCLCLEDIEAIPPATLADWFDRYYLVPSEYPARFPDADDYFAVAPYPREQQDYIYDLDRLARLDELGPPRHRTYLRQFVRRYPNFELRELTTADRGPCEDLFKRWVVSKQLGPAPVDGSDWEQGAFQTAWDHFDALGLQGLGLLVDGAIVAFLLYDALTPRTLLCHFAKSDYSVRSSGTAILWLGARELRRRFAYLNFAQDLGLPGLRRHKESLQPLVITGFLHLTRRRDASRIGGTQ